jgi:hypothetical protein
MKTLTIKQLRTLGACRSTVALLAGTFGDAAQVTEANCLKVAFAGAYNSGARN